MFGINIRQHQNEPLASKVCQPVDLVKKPKGITTMLTGKCGDQCHDWSIDPEKVDKKRGANERMEHFALNLVLIRVMQSMGSGGTPVETIIGHLYLAKTNSFAQSYHKMEE